LPVLLVVRQLAGKCSQIRDLVGAQLVPQAHAPALAAAGQFVVTVLEQQVSPGVEVLPSLPDAVAAHVLLMAASHWFGVARAGQSALPAVAEAPFVPAVVEALLMAERAEGERHAPLQAVVLEAAYPRPGEQLAAVQPDEAAQLCPAKQGWALPELVRSRTVRQNPVLSALRGPLEPW
jgi:hypothetical protein